MVEDYSKRSQLGSLFYIYTLIICISEFKRYLKSSLLLSSFLTQQNKCKNLKKILAGREMF